MSGKEPCPGGYTDTRDAPIEVQRIAEAVRIIIMQPANFRSLRIQLAMQECNVLFEAKEDVSPLVCMYYVGPLAVGD